MSKNNQFNNEQSPLKRFRLIFKSLKISLLGNKGKECCTIVQQNENTVQDLQHDSQISKEDKSTDLANSPEIEVGQIFEMIVHELQCQRLELRQMLNSLKEKQLQMKLLKEQECWCKDCLDQMKLPHVDIFSIQLSNDMPAAARKQEEAEEQLRHGMLEMDDWEEIEQQIKYLEAARDGWESDEPPFDRHNIYEFYAMHAQPKNERSAKRNWREKLRRDRRCNKNYWIDKEKTAQAELDVIKNEISQSLECVNKHNVVKPYQRKIITMTTTVSAIQLENSMKDNNANTRGVPRQDSVWQYEKRRSKIGSTLDPLRDSSDNTEIFGTQQSNNPEIFDTRQPNNAKISGTQQHAVSTAPLENNGVLNTNETVAPLLEEQSKEQMITLPEESERQEETNNIVCPDDCTCRVTRALHLILDEMKKVDSVISEMKMRNMCVYIPTAEEKKVFIDSIKENSQVCHVIINELKGQRIQINEMLRMYNDSTGRFSRLEAAMDQQSYKVREIEADVTRVLEALEILQKEAEERHALFLRERAEREVKDEEDEELHRKDMAWLSTLEECRKKQVKDEEKRDEDQELKRIKDRAMLTAAIRQLQELTVAQRRRGICRENCLGFRNNPAKKLNAKFPPHLSNSNKPIIIISPKRISDCYYSGISAFDSKKPNTTDQTLMPNVYRSHVQTSRTYLYRMRKNEYSAFRQGTIEDHTQPNGRYATEYRIQNCSQQNNLCWWHILNGSMKLAANTPHTEPTGVVRRSKQEPIQGTNDALANNEKHCKDIRTINKNQNNIRKVRPWFGHHKKHCV